MKRLDYAACAAGLILSISSAAASETLAGGVLSFVRAETEIVPQTFFWEDMSEAQRLALWPILTHEQRLMQWRYMGKNERRAMRMNMTSTEREAMKRRYVIDGSLLLAARALPVRRLSTEEKDLLRRQVREVHVEIRSGVPYNCTDPTDCPYSKARIKAQEAPRRGE